MAHSCLSQGKKAETPVTFSKEEHGQDREQKKLRDMSPAPNPAEVNLPPPPTAFVIKDEVELLRQGTKNRHGDNVKTSAVDKPPTKG